MNDPKPFKAGDPVLFHLDGKSHKGIIHRLSRPSNYLAIIRYDNSKFASRKTSQLSPNP